MSDKELLELAAKAAGHSIVWGGVYKIGADDGDEVDCTNMSYIAGDQVDEADAYWNPLEDDGDALCLAVKLELELRLRHSENVVRVYGAPSGAIDEGVRGDACAATRRAIVRAAAELGKSIE